MFSSVCLCVNEVVLLIKYLCIFIFLIGFIVACNDNESLEDTVESNQIQGQHLINIAMSSLKDINSYSIKANLLKRSLANSDTKMFLMADGLIDDDNSAFEFTIGLEEVDFETKMVFFTRIIDKEFFIKEPGKTSWLIDRAHPFIELHRLLISLWDQELILMKEFVGYGELDGQLMYIVSGSDKNNPHVEITLWISIATTELTKAYIHGLMTPKLDYVDLSVKYDFRQTETKIEKPSLQTIFERNN